MKIHRHNSSIQIKNINKYWEFWAFLAETGGYEWADIHFPTNKQMAIGLKRYYKNRKRHLRPNSRFMQVREQMRRVT